MRHLIVSLMLLLGVAVTQNARADYANYPGYGDKHWKAPVAGAGDLPTSGNAVGDSRIVLSGLSLFVWTGSSWVNITNGATWIYTEAGLTLETEDGLLLQLE